MPILVPPFTKKLREKILQSEQFQNVIEKKRFYDLLYVNLLLSHILMEYCSSDIKQQTLILRENYKL